MEKAHGGGWAIVIAGFAYSGLRPWAASCFGREDGGERGESVARWLGEVVVVDYRQSPAQIGMQMSKDRWRGDVVFKEPAVPASQSQLPSLEGVNSRVEAWRAGS